MDFFSVQKREGKLDGRPVKVIFPEFRNRRSKEFMIRGKSFYAIWDEKLGMWSRDERAVIDVVDDALRGYENGLKSYNIDTYVESMATFKGVGNNSWLTYLSWLRNMPDNYRPLDQKVTYLSQQTTLKDYASKRLPYDLEDGEPEAYNELMSTLYDPKERRKLEWAIGAILNGDGKYIQKMFVLYGPPGSGKSTFLHIVEQLLVGYWTIFDAKSLTSNSSNFSTHFFKDNPLVAIQHDGQLSKIEDNSLLNSIVSHEDIVVNEKFKAQYVDRANCLLFLGTNSPVKISDSKSGLIRRLIDVSPSGRKVDPQLYFDLMDRIPFELGKIANHCIKVYRHFGKRYYDTYRPLSMMYATDVFFNFVVDNRVIFENDDPIEIERAYAMYKDYCEKTNASFISQRYKFREEFENYYDRYDKTLKQFFGFKAWLLDETELDGEKEDANDSRWIILDQKESIFDKEQSNALAQYANKDEVPFEAWEKVSRVLREIDTTKLHYVKVPENHIVIDFDLKNKKGEKDARLNLEAANKWPPTYAEYSKGGSGIHLHYIYDGDVTKLSRIYSDGIEVKVFTGGSSLRRKLTLCNNLPIAHISTGLPLKEDKKVISDTALKDEQHLRNLIKKNLRKEIHAYTKPSIDYIYKLLEDAYKSGMHYDVRDMRQKVLTFAMGSSHQKDACIKIVNQMKFCSEESSDSNEIGYKDDRLVFVDCEVFSNLFLVCWKFRGAPDCVVMFNPTPKEIGELMKYKLVGFNAKKYDAHVMYACYVGYTPEQIYKLSQKIIKDHTGFFREAYNMFYLDIYDYSVKKQSLKKWEIEMDIHHQELGFDWDAPAPEDKWTLIADYCKNDVNATEALFEYIQTDFVAREMLSDICEKPRNTSTNQLTTQIIFQGNRTPKLVYTDFERGVAF